MDNRLASGTFDWRQQQIVLDVPRDAVTINYGLILAGGGQAWVDDFAFEVVDKHVKSTNKLEREVPSRPIPPDRFFTLPMDAVNTDFEQESIPKPNTDLLLHPDRE